VHPVISAEQMREIDRLTTQDYELSPNQLMFNAAGCCYEEINLRFENDLAGKKALILCGPGNNGGDGAELGMGLYHAGVHTDIVLFASLGTPKGAAGNAFGMVRREVLAIEKASDAGHQPAATLTLRECTDEESWAKLALVATDYDVVVDSLFGTGLTRPLTGLFLKAADFMSGGHLVLSVDIPSGLNADLPKTIGCAVQADVTVTFTAPKIANVLPPASRLSGDLVIGHIGSPKALLDATNPTLFLVEENDAREWLISTRYTPDSYKNAHGHVLVIAGSRGYTGAAVLCGNAAMRSGAGLVTIATPASAQPTIAASVMPEVMTTALAETDRGAVSDEAIDHVMDLAAKASVIAIGPGLTADDERTRRFAYSVIERRQTPVVIDADALNCLAKYSANGWPSELQGSEEAPLILTPHAGEMLRLLGTTNKSALAARVAMARDFAVKHKLILVLKGERSLIAAPDGRVFINPTGNAGLGTAGAGDTLTGIIAGFVAQAGSGFYGKADALRSVIAALYVGGLAGDLAARKLGMRTMVASDIREHLSEAICSLDPKGEHP
jgi:NAD(P)H-hydrate epimerase